MAKRSKRINLTKDIDKTKVNKETLKILQKYKIDMGLRELSEKTIYGYVTDLFAWFAYIYMFQDNKSVKEIDEDDLTEFFYFCKSEGNNSRRMKRRMASLSAFFKFLKKKKEIKENPMEFMDRPRKDTDVVVQTFLTKEQVELMKHKLEEYGDLQLLTYAMFSLSTMARVNAVSNIKWEQIDFDLRTVNDVLEKEGKIVTLYFNNYTKKLLLKLKKELESKEISSDYVFNSKYNGIYDKVQNTTMALWCKKIGEMIGVQTLHPHDFRHSNATLLKNAGLSLESVSSLLSHSGTDVTLKHYIAQDKKKIQEEKDKFDIF